MIRIFLTLLLLKLIGIINVSWLIIFLPIIIQESIYLKDYLALIKWRIGDKYDVNN